MGSKNNSNVRDYLSYPKQFLPYKWFKPLLVTLLGGAFFFVFTVVLSIIGFVFAVSQGYSPQSFMASLTGGYDGFDAYSPVGAIMSLGSITCFIPALLLSNRIVNSRPFSSYSSSRGGFNFVEFFKCMVVALIVLGLPIIIASLIYDEKTGINKFTVFGFIICTILGPLQCVAEEYVFRGHLMQMFGSWIKFPVIPVILQTIFFAMLHPYNIAGVISVAVLGLILGFCTYFTKGLEASSALHIVNNMVAFYLTGFGIGGISKDVEIAPTILVAVCALIYLAFMIFASKKLGWFSKVKKDDVAEFNAKIEERRQAKAN